MSFWAYMLHCRGGSFYVGQTNDLVRRIAQHKHGEIAGFTQDHLPVALVWSQEFPTRDEAKAAEQRVKGWSRAKKLALIRGDWEGISRLARKKDSPSTSSGQAGLGSGAGSGQRRGDSAPNPACPEPVEGLSSLTPHPNIPPLAVSAVRARITGISEHWLTLRWSVTGAGRIVLSPFSGKHRADGLWQHTCFEMFLQSPGSDAYIELNLSPSEGWAAYDFARYREGMADRAMPRPPDCTVRIGGNTLIFDAAIPMAALPPLPWRVGLTAVIEEEGGVMSYWALAHPPGPPDFHHAACLALTVPALDQNEHAP